jgi:hypothetical protein
MNRVGIYLCSCLLWLLLSFKAKAWISQRTIRISRSCRFSFNETSSDAPNDASGVDSFITRRPPIQRPSRRPVTVVAQDRREQQQRAVQRSRIANNDPFLLSDVRWEDLSMAPASLRAVTELEGWERLTQIQARSWPHVLNGTSLVAKARTGTGKVRKTICWKTTSSVSLFPHLLTGVIVVLTRHWPICCPPFRDCWRRMPSSFDLVEQ